MSTKTGYSITGGGGRGYINVGGWNTTLTDKQATQMEVPGITRREGANVYIYGYQGTLSIEGAGSHVIFGTPASDAAGLMSPTVFTIGPVGTANATLIRAATIQSMSGAVYGWYFKEGIATVTMGDNSGGCTVGSPIVPATASAGVWATAAATGYGYALTAMAAAASGLAWVKFPI